ncbi:NifU family protein [Tepidamorphus sp. 3E244]|uniref:NifU family protein n=1 Tax=Tepidamorphus sp. 3E244 TaxID=3385498 RepID=UPI0038FCAB96
MFIQTETTPNPATLKFLPGRAVLPGDTLDMRSAEDAEISPLASALFAVDGVSGVFYGADFIAVTKDEQVDWQFIKPAILGSIMEHFMSGGPLLAGEHEEQVGDEEFFDESDTQTVETIKELLETRVRPAVAHDGGDIAFRGFKDGIVYLHMRGACAGCPSSTATLKNGIQNLLRHFLPDVEEVRPV